jgi:transcriptional regulator with XRE-family HTH domain
MATVIRELEAIERMHSEFGFSYLELAQALRTNESTLHRWRSGEGAEPTPVYVSRLEAFGAFLDELSRTFKKTADTRKWMRESMPLFKGRSPRDLILDGHVDRVTGALYALNAGVDL